MNEPKHIIDRDAARVVLVNQADRVLLFRCEEPGAGRSFWITPGGGLEADETHEQAALRELEEETGLVGVPIGPCVWVRTHTFPWLGKTYRQRERFYLVRIDGHQVDRVGHTQEELMVLVEHRWWSVEELHAASGETFAPGRIAEHLEPLIAGTDLSQPIDVGP